MAFWQDVALPLPPLRMPNVSDNHREIELKFAIDAEAEALLQAHPLLAGSEAPRSQDLVSTYFDTPDGRLRRRKCSLRIRRSGSRITQTLKGPGRSAADRDEYEHGHSGTFPQVKWLRSTPLWSKVGGDRISGSLEAQFSVEVTRTTIPVSFGDASIEVAIDVGAVHARDHSAPIHECELELKGGPETALWAFARRLSDDLPLRLSLITKAEQGFDLLEGSPVLRKTVQVDLAEVETIAEAFATVLQACLSAICRNALLIGADHPSGNGVHETRIAVRHLRAALDVFRPALKRERLSRILGHVKWISDKLGEARDADVFDATAPQRVGDQDEGQEAFEAVAAHMQDLREHSHRELTAAVQSSRWRHLLLDLLEFSVEGVRRSKRDDAAAAFVVQQLTRRRTELADLTRRWSKRSSDELHDIRKRAKMLRYALDLLAPLPGLGVKKHKVKALTASLQALQQELGEIHDADAMRERLGDVFLRGKAPGHVKQSEWLGIQRAALDLAASLPHDNHALAKAHQAARKLRRSKAF